MERTSPELDQSRTRALSGPASPADSDMPKSVDLRGKVVILGEPQTGKTTLVSMIRGRPIKTSGAESVAGYCIYSEKIPSFVIDKSLTCEDEDAVSAKISVNMRLQITEVRQYQAYGSLLLNEAVKRLISGSA